jgi:hydrogenase-4 component B
LTPGLLLIMAAVGLATGAVAFKFGRFWLWATTVGNAVALGAAIFVLGSDKVWEWQPDILLGGERLHLRLDGISAFFLALLALVGGAGTLFASEYWTEVAHPVSAPSSRAWWNGLLVTMGLVLLAANGLHFLIFWELFALSAYFLITTERHLPEVRSAGRLYLVASHAGTLCLFAFFALLAARTGSWELQAMSDRADLAPLFWVALAGFSLKAGVFPLHIWLPSAHASAPSHVSALMSGVAIKMGVYGLVRFTGLLPVPVAGGWVVVGLGMASALFGVAFALGQHDLKRLLAYHSVENIGIVLIGLGFAIVASGSGAAWGQLALSGGLLHVWNHGLFKALLFLGAGSVLRATGTRRMSNLGGLWQAMPWTSGLFGLGAVAIVGLPPLNGFISEWLIYLALFDAVGTPSLNTWAAIPAAVVLAMTGALALACFVKVCGVVFLGLPRTEGAQCARECGWWMRAPMLLLGAVCVAIGLAPIFFWPAVAAASRAWHPPGAETGVMAPLEFVGTLHLGLMLLVIVGAALLWRRCRSNGVEREGTWDCGYAAPTPRMQYTAGSFASMITGWFGWILRPRRNVHRPRGPFPGQATYEEHTPETVLEHVIHPAGLVIMGLSAAVRRLQHGRLQAYLIYLLTGLAALALLAVWGGAR